MNTQQVKPDLYELQKLDCNCNDCKHLVRDLEKFNKKTEKSRVLQKEFFDVCITNALNRNEENKVRIEKRKLSREKEVKLLKENEQQKKEILEKKFFFVKKDTNYGYCNKLEKEITFYPNTLSLETQSCFVHRRDR